MFSGTAPEEFRDLESPECFVCKQKRGRKYYAVVENDDGERPVVGSSCYKFCSGDISANMILSYGNMFYEIEKEVEGNDILTENYRSAAYPTRKYLAL